MINPANFSLGLITGLYSYSLFDMKRTLFKIFATGLIFYSQAAFTYNIDCSKISVSGLSSGGYMAGQMAVANSETIMGVGIFAAGPYYCANNSLEGAISTCSQILGGGEITKVDVNALITKTREFAKKGLIDSPENMKRMRVYGFTGMKDELVPQSLVKDNISYFSGVGVSEDAIKIEDSVKAGHAYPTVDYGNPCDTTRSSPFISNCNFDGAGAALRHIYGDLKPKTRALDENYFSMSQVTESLPNPRNISMGDEAMVYVPTRCQTASTPCRLHIAFHGCKQTMFDIDDQFVRHTGYNEWAEANDIIVLYPQAVRSLGYNPDGCWDWWGYSTQTFSAEPAPVPGQYATKKGPQIKAVNELIAKLMKPDFKIPK